uniref:Uncharacterized protein n=1 Tax=Oryza punctata TaxID=4537 RepID=A0A0E0K9U0_ORYPU
MPLLPAPFRALAPVAAAAPRRAAAGEGQGQALRRVRHSSLNGAILFLSIGAASTAVACRTGCAFSHRRFPFLGVRGLSSAWMESASTTMPSIVVYVTVPNREAGKKLSQSIISEKLAACVNIVPGIESVYWWEGKVQTDAEELLIIKTRESLLDALTEHVKANHEYE